MLLAWSALLVSAACVDDLDNEAHRVYNFRRQKMILKVIVLYFLGRESALK